MQLEVLAVGRVLFDVGVRSGQSDGGNEVLLGRGHAVVQALNTEGQKRVQWVRLGYGGSDSRLVVQ